MSLLHARAGTFYGGWAAIQLSGGDCPADSSICGAKSCCPANTFCDDTSSTFSNFCCPSGSDCSEAVIAASTCADSTWILFNTVEDPICCAPGQVAIQPGSGDSQGSCIDAAGAGTIAPYLLAPTAITGHPAHTGTAGVVPTIGTDLLATQVYSGGSGSASATASGKTTKTTSAATAKTTSTATTTSGTPTGQATATVTGSSKSAGVSGRVASVGKVFVGALVVSLFLM